LKKLSADKNGLSTSEAKDRLQKYGYNEITGKKGSPLLKLLGSFWGPIPWMMEAAAILSAILGDWTNFWIIFALLLFIAVAGFWQEKKADNAIELLKQKLALQARVLRDGKWSDIPARELVPGDIAHVHLGDIAPADIKLTEGEYLLVDESALTGESLPAEKHISDVTYSGSLIRQGGMNALVVATGINTFFGKTAALVEEVETQSHIQKAVTKIGSYLIALAIVMVALTFVVGSFRHEPVLQTLEYALILIIAAIPLSLPLLITVSLGVGAINLAKKKAIVSKLAAIGEMAGMDILCSDKTGTITKNELTLAEVVPFGEFKHNDVLLYATLASREEDKDPIDNAIITKTQQVLLEAPSSYKTIEFKPFDPVSKRTEATIESADGNRFKVTKGAPQVILSLATDKESIHAGVEEGVNAFAAKGYRTLGVAIARTSGDTQGNWQFIGIVPLYDPPREDSKQTIDTAESMGVDVKMVTGDHIAIAKEVGRQVGMGTNILPAATLSDKSDSEAERLVEDANGFAQVFPEHKFHIVELLQGKQHIVGMTGDGVNDAPALKKANAGIAVAGATDVARSAADIVFTMPGLFVIIDAIKESRKIFLRLNSFTIYRIAASICLLFFITLSIIIFDFYPVTVVMILLLTLLNDAPIGLIIYDNVHYRNKPEKWDMKGIMSMAALLGVIGVIFSFILLYIGVDVLHLTKEMIQSFIFLQLVVSIHLIIFITRTRGHFWSIKPGSALLWSAVATKLLATLMVVYGLFVPAIGWYYAGIVWAYCLAAFVVTDFIKVSVFKRF
jgi:H+-transporting ATPase